jgi:hypothetical protein
VVDVQVTCDKLTSLHSATISTVTPQPNLQEGQDEDTCCYITSGDRNAENASEKIPANNHENGEDFVEITCVNELECQSRPKRWVLSSGTDVLSVLSAYEKTVPDSQKCLK